jgi:hypothetical protein
MAQQKWPAVLAGPLRALSVRSPRLRLSAPRVAPAGSSRHTARREKLTAMAKATRPRQSPMSQKKRRECRSRRWGSPLRGRGAVSPCALGPGRRRGTERSVANGDDNGMTTAHTVRDDTPGHLRDSTYAHSQDLPLGRHTCCPGTGQSFNLLFPIIFSCYVNMSVRPHGLEARLQRVLPTDLSTGWDRSMAIPATGLRAPSDRIAGSISASPIP